MESGYILLGGGRRAFERSVTYHRPLRSWASRINRSVGVGGYVTLISLVAAIFLAAPLLALDAVGVAPAVLGLLSVLGAIPAVDAAVALVNRAVNIGFAASLLPALELLEGVPAHLRTLVAVPTLLTTLEGVEDLIERLEIHHLASPEGDLHFALLTDWADAVSEHAEGDALLITAAADGVARLNLRYGPAPGGTRFHLLHRRRVWNEGESRWIGWERKRGKLHELNRLLRGAADTTFLDVGFGTPAAPMGIRYVVTLDSDTRLPRDAVRRLIGKMAHPLNRPRLDPDGRRVVDGYAVLQPRVTPSLPIGGKGSLFQKYSRALAVSIGTPRQFPTFIRICSGKDPMPEKASTTWTLSRLRSRIAHQTRPSLATICSRACSRARASPRMSRSSRNSRLATTSAPIAITAGRVATGNCFPGFLGVGRHSSETRRRPASFRLSAAGKCWTICAARSLRPRRSLRC